jgi:DNA-binding NtrC family response regulator
VVARGLEERNQRRAVAAARRPSDAANVPRQIIGQSAALRAVLDLAAKFAASGANVLVTGASGTGKELVARLLHANSPRRDRPFVAVDCAALPANLMESELFGYEKGAFTGANQPKRGLLEAAHKGTVFFDEIGEMNAELQAKLLRVLQERAFRRLGGEELVHVDIRVLCSTNRDLQAEARRGSFREDLLFRLNVVTITLPLLREREGDTRLLAEHFVQVFANREGVTIGAEALALLQQYSWPGNVRELRNAIERAVVLCEGNVIRPQDLPPAVSEAEALPSAAEASGYKVARERWVDLQGKEYLTALLRHHGGNVSAAAREAQISRKSFYELMKRFNIENPVSFR